MLALVGLDGLLGDRDLRPRAHAGCSDGPGLVAVDLAEWLVRRDPVPGRPRPRRHARAESIERGVPLAELVEAHPDFEDEALEVLDAGAALRRRTTPGGTGPDAVVLQLDRFDTASAADATRLAEREA